MAHGTPSSWTRCRNTCAWCGADGHLPELIAEMRHNYEAIGGKSPLTDLTLAQAEALARGLVRTAGRRRDAQLEAVHQGRDRRTRGERRGDHRDSARAAVLDAERHNTWTRRRSPPGGISLDPIIVLRPSIAPRRVRGTTARGGSACDEESCSPPTACRCV